MISNKQGIYKLSNELLKGPRLRILGNQERSRKSKKFVLSMTMPRSKVSPFPQPTCLKCKHSPFPSPHPHNEKITVPIQCYLPYTALPTANQYFQVYTTILLLKKTGLNKSNNMEKSPKYTALAFPHPEFLFVGQPWWLTFLKTFSRIPKNSQLRPCIKFSVCQFSFVKTKLICSKKIVNKRRKKNQRCYYK